MTLENKLRAIVFAPNLEKARALRDQASLVHARSMAENWHNSDRFLLRLKEAQEFVEMLEKEENKMTKPKLSVPIQLAEFKKLTARDIFTDLIYNAFKESDMENWKKDVDARMTRWHKEGANFICFQPTFAPDPEDEKRALLGRRMKGFYDAAILGAQVMPMCNCAKTEAEFEEETNKLFKEFMKYGNGCSAHISHHISHAHPFYITRH